MPRLLIIDDDCSLFALLAEYLGASGYSSAHAPDGNAGLAAVAAEPWDVVILDVMLPGLDGHEVLRRIRANPATGALPVLMLTARGEEDDKVLGLELGADDYLAKPFGPKELLARLRALLRRTRHAGGDAVLVLDDMLVEKDAMIVAVGDARLEITPSELRLLELFAENPGTAIPRAELHEKITGRRLFAQDRSLDMMISRLRKKLGSRRDGGERIRAARNEGYMFLLSETMRREDHVDYAKLKAAAPDLELSHDNLFHSVLGLVEIDTELYDPELDFFKPFRTEELPYR